MNRILSLLLIASLVVAVSIGAEELDRTYRSGWYMIWHDEFDGGALDTTKWRAEDAALVKNNELQYYAPDEVIVEGGLLKLRSSKRSMGGRKYTSGLVETKGLFSQTYGRFETRAKMPHGQGIWPAHWMLPENGGWPPEIDIVELLGDNPKTVHMSLHWGTPPNVITATEFFDGPDFSEDFHTYAIEWGPKQIRWFVDDELRFKTSENIPREAFYIILNTAVGGDWPGDPDKTTVFPQYHLVDYVRVFGRDVPGTFFLTTSALNGRILQAPRQSRYASGSSVALKAKPAIGYRFSRWSGDVGGDENPLLVTMDKHKTVEAIFVPDANGAMLLSRNAEVKASSRESAWLDAKYAVDTKKSTRWSSKFSDNEWIYVDLGEVFTIEAVRLTWETAYAKAFKLQVSDNAKNWKTIYATDRGSGNVQEIADLQAKGRFVRLYGIERGSIWGYSLFDFEVFGRSLGPERSVFVE